MKGPVSRNIGYKAEQGIYPIINCIIVATLKMYVRIANSGEDGSLLSDYDTLKQKLTETQIKVGLVDLLSIKYAR